MSQTTGFNLSNTLEAMGHALTPEEKLLLDIAITIEPRFRSGRSVSNRVLRQVLRHHHSRRIERFEITHAVRSLIVRKLLTMDDGRLTLTVRLKPVPNAVRGVGVAA